MITSTAKLVEGSKVPIEIFVIGTIILIIIGILSVLSMNDLMKHIVYDKVLSIEWWPFIVSLYFVVILTQNLIAQYNLEFTNAVISIIYVISAFSWIVFGFAKKYVIIRRFGLGLSFLAIAKLFMIDLAFLEEGYRIISYFAFGITLLAISFVYQHYSKKLTY